MRPLGAVTWCRPKFSGLFIEVFATDRRGGQFSSWWIQVPVLDDNQRGGVYAAVGRQLFAHTLSRRNTAEDHAIFGFVRIGVNSLMTLTSTQGSSHYFYD